MGGRSWSPGLRDLALGSAAPQAGAGPAGGGCLAVWRLAGSVRAALATSYQRLSQRSQLVCSLLAELGQVGIWASAITLC